MKQPDSVDIGTRMDVAKHRLDVAQEDLDTRKGADGVYRNRTRIGRSLRMGYSNRK